jgi:hypothetical protein
MSASARAVVQGVASLFFCGFLPLWALYVLFSSIASEGTQLVDFHYAYYRAAEAILAGEDIYPTHGFIVRGGQEIVVDYVYPPLIAIVTVPWTFLSAGLAEVLFAAMLAIAVLVTLALLDVRDWRCYGLAFIWPPVTDAVITGNVTILLGLGAALVWRFRDAPLASGASLGVSIATKVFLWPITVYLVATRRIAAAVWSLAVGGAVLLVSWGVIGFRGFADYPDLMRRLGDRLDERSYTLYALGVDIGLSASLARLLWLALAATTLVAIVVVARKGDQRRAFILALTAAIACSPIVWLHYFALLLVVVAIAQPRLGPLWFIGFPIQVFVTTAVYNGSTFQTAAMLATAAVTVLLALGASAPRRTRFPLSSPAASRP